MAVAVRAAEEVSVGVEKGKAVAGMETEAVGTAGGGGRRWRCNDYRQRLFLCHVRWTDVGDCDTKGG